MILASSIVLVLVLVLDLDFSGREPLVGSQALPATPLQAHSHINT
jgi:hypothetical protein